MTAAPFGVTMSTSTARSVDLLEASRVLHEHPNTTRRHVLSGALRHFRTGNRIRIRVEDLERFLISQQTVTDRRGRPEGAVRDMKAK